VGGNTVASLTLAKARPSEASTSTTSRGRHRSGLNGVR
jgi:hypothetical protein